MVHRSAGMDWYSW